MSATIMKRAYGDSCIGSGTFIPKSEDTTFGIVKRIVTMVRVLMVVFRVLVIIASEAERTF